MARLLIVYFLIAGGLGAYFFDYHLLFIKIFYGFFFGIFWGVIGLLIFYMFIWEKGSEYEFEDVEGSSIKRFKNNN